MEAAAYDAWYDTPRGHGIGTTEFRLLDGLLRPRPGDTLLDVGCGTGWFTRRFAEKDLFVTGLDPNPDWLAFARAKGPPAIRWVRGDARALPFPDRGFDRVVSIAALCFVDDERRAVAEIVRVTRRRFAVGWLNRTSLLYRQKGQGGGSGAYHGAQWHRTGELLDFFSGLTLRRLTVHSAVFLPSGSGLARATERILPHTLTWGGLIVISGERE
jgi:SAM-dependent methyltransferase